MAHLQGPELMFKRALLTLDGSALSEEAIPGSVIVSAAREEQRDIIVMSTRGRSRIRWLVLGSVADRVVRNAEQSDVLLVRPGRGERQL